MSQQSLYLWAIVPPAPFEEQIDAIRKEFAANFQVKEALRRPVHLTLYNPFQLPAPMSANETDKLARWISLQPAFTMDLKNFGFFENPKSPVVFIAVQPNETLKQLNSGIKRQTRSLFELEDIGKDTFHPHFTVGFRDVKPAVFQEVKQAYSKRLFAASFKVDTVCLFKHNGTCWELRHRFALGGGIIEQGALF